jgi:arsenic resistance protein ArsH
MAVEDRGRLLQLFGCETRIFDPNNLPLLLPLPDQVAADGSPAVHELRAFSGGLEAQVSCSQERGGQVTGIMKA